MHAALHVASAQREEGHEAGDEFLLDDAGLEESTWRGSEEERSDQSPRGFRAYACARVTGWCLINYEGLLLVLLLYAAAAMASCRSADLISSLSRPACRFSRATLLITSSPVVLRGKHATTLSVSSE